MGLPAQLRIDSRTATAGLVYYQGSFAIGAAGAVTANSTRGDRIKSVTKTGTGTYLITFYDYGGVYEVAKSTSLETAGTGAWAGEGAFTVGTSAASPNTFTVYTYNAAGTATDLTTGRLSFEVQLKNSKVGG